MARRWTAQIVSDTVAATTQSVYDLVDPADIEQSTSLEPDSMTLVSIRGWLSLQTSSAAAGVIYGGIYHCDELAGTTAVNPNSADHLIQADWLWTFGTFHNQTDQGIWTYEVNVKAKRKLKRSDVRLVVLAGAADVDIAGVFRALILGG